MQTKARIPRHRWKMLSGPLLTLVAVAAVEVLNRTALTIPNPAPIYLIAVTYAAFQGGAPVGLISAVIALLYDTYFFSEPGQLFHYTGTNAWRLLVNAVAAPAIAILVGRLRQAQRASEAQLRETAVRLRWLMDAVPVGIAVNTLSGKVIETNPALWRMFGYASQEDFLAAPAAAHYADPADRQRFVDLHQQGLVRDFETRFRRGDGTIFWGATSSQAQVTPAGETRYINVIQDITARKQAEAELWQLNDDLTQRKHELEERNSQLREQAEALARSNRELAQKNEENEMFVYSVSHDLRSPLVNLEGFSQELGLVSQDLRDLLTASDLPPAEKQRALALLDDDMASSLRFIQTGVLRLGTIIDALLRLSRAGRVEYRWQPVDLQTTVARVVDSLHDTIAARGILVTVGELPQVWGDPAALEQVFANLIDNAVTYLDPRRPGQIDVGYMPDAPVDDMRPGQRVFYVRDNGLGIRKQAQAKVFQIFQRLHPGVGQGEGLGLAIVRRVIERHGGQIWVESTEGAGTTFFLTLSEPAGPPQFGDPEVPPEGALAPAGHKQRRRE